ncbi:MAG: hypothetical protein GC149_02710 [Gammaproteobacteria bacterium]|nr:hypothetical protein [Gammaproteobacteria bacterium]
MIHFPRTLAAWNTADLADTLKREVSDVDTALLPLQDALAHSSYVSESRLDPVVLASWETEESIYIKTGIFYSGIVAGSCCADDPGPLCEQPEYCELLFNIAKADASVDVTLLTQD